jgi:hypothetical protein
MDLEDVSEKIQRAFGKVERPRVKCRVCHIPMNSDAENRLGVHVRCVYDMSRRAERRIKGPSYGRRRKEEGGG